MANYAILCRNKLKSVNAMVDAYKHNERIYSVANADPELIDQNRELIEAYGRNYEELLQDTLRQLKAAGVKERVVRSNAVRGFEIMMTFSRENAASIDVDAWAKQSMDWVDRYFNPADHEIHYQDAVTGEEKSLVIQNIKHAVLHLDESNPHIHCFVVPIDERGNLNASAYDGRAFLKEMQSSYSKEMAPFGLERGVEGSIAEHQKISKYYSYLNKIVEAELPPPMPGETIDEYRERANEIYRIEQAQHRDQILKKDQEINAVRSEERAHSRPHLVKDNMVRRELDRLREYMGVDELTRDDVSNVAHIVSEQKKFEEAVKNHPDRSKAEEAERLHKEMVLWQNSRTLKEISRNRKEREKDRREVE